MGQIRKLQNEAYKTARQHGFIEATFAQRIALIHSELSEALEWYRESGDFEGTFEDSKPVGVPSELADVVIRVLDLCGYIDVDLESAIIDKMAYNTTRPYRHGDKVL